MELASGAIIGGRYAVEGVLGQGGMAVVYRVRHAALGTPHALKVLAIPVAAIQKRLMDEGRAQGNLRHENVVSVTDVVTVKGAPGLVMELVDGPSLDLLLQRRRLTMEQVDVIARGVLAGVSAAHSAGLVHRDLKPGNVLLEVSGRRMVPKITDFGLAKILAVDNEDGGSTRSGASMGTPAYMAPEQIRDAKNVDQRADLFSLGALLYEMVTGTRAFVGKDTLEIFKAVDEGRYVPVHELDATVPQRMVRAIEAALRGDLSERVGSCDELAQLWGGGLEPIASGPWSEDELHQARSMAPVPPTRGPSQPTFEDDGGQTFAMAEDRAETPTRVDHAASGSKSWGLSLAAAFLILLGVGLAGLWYASPEVPQNMAARTTVVISLDEVAQRQFEQSWEALLRADFASSSRYAISAVELAPDAIHPKLVAVIALGAEKRTAEAVPFIEAANDLAVEQEGHIAAAARVLATGDGSKLLALAMNHPDDLLVQLLAAMFADVPMADRLEVIDRVLAAHPNLTFPHYIRCATLFRMGRDEDLDAALANGLAVDPSNERMRLLSAVVELERGHAQVAAQMLAQLLADEPGMFQARMTLVTALYHLGRSGEAREHEEVLEADAAPLDQRLRYAMHQSNELMGRGQLNASRAKLDWALDLARDAGQWLDYAQLAAIALNIDAHAHDPDRWEKDIAPVREAMNAPEIPQRYRDQLLQLVLVSEGIIAVMREEPDQAERLLKRLENSDAEDGFVNQLRWWLAASRGDVDEVNERLAGDHCAARYVRGRLLFDMGEAEAAVAAFTPMATGDAACSPRGTEAWSRAEAVSALAWLEWTAGNRDAATQYVDQFDQLWPAPDSDAVPALLVGEVRHAVVAQAFEVAGDEVEE
jgi:serine/threonine protein kinase